MAYTVGSASVDIVPDFKNAQLAITRFFNSQKNEIKIPVRLDVDESGNSKVEQDAAKLGSRVGKAMNDGMAKSQAAADRLALQMAEGAEKSKLRAHAEALRINAAMDREAARQAKDLLDRQTRERIESERLAEQISEGASRARLRAHTEALRMNAEFDRAVAASAREQARLAAQQAREEEAAAKRQLRLEEAVAAQQRKIREQEAAASSKQRQREFVESERLFQAELRSQISALKAASKAATEEEKIRLKVEIDERQAILEGHQAGGLVTRAMREELRQSAGLIAAATAGVLAAGAPAAIGAAVALFGGIGAVAAAQSQRVRTAWVGTWDEIRTSAIADAQVLVPFYERAAVTIGNAFQRMRPQIQSAFQALGPQIDSFTGSITRAAENALPGLVRSVETAGPVVRGLGSLLEHVGTGIGSFFETLSTHSPAAGRAATELGRSLEALLPSLAELLGQGAETASIVLPAVTAGFRGLHGVLDAVGGVLPTIAASFFAFRTVQGTGRMIGNFAAQLGMVSISGGKAAGVAGKLAGGLTSVGRAIPGISVAAAVLGGVFAAVEDRFNSLVDGLNQGGYAAKAAMEELANPDLGDRILYNLIHPFAGSFGVMDQKTAQMQQAKRENEKYLESLSPLERAQRQVSIETENLAKATGNTAPQVEALQRAQARLAAEEARLEKATRGVTDAMVAQGEASRARVDSAFAYEDALNDLEDAQKDLNDAMKDGTTEDQSRALLELQKAYGGVAEAARQVAFDALPALLDEKQKNILADKAQLDALNELHGQYGDLGPILEAQRQSLAASTSGANAAKLEQAQLAAALSEVGAAVESIPNSAAVKIEADDVPLVRERLEELGFHITNLPGGKVLVEAKTDEAKGHLGELSTLLADLGIQVAEPTVDLRKEQFETHMKDVLGQIEFLGGQRPKPVADMFIGPLQDESKRATVELDTLNRQTPTPRASLDPRSFQGFYGQIMGDIGTLGRQNPTPTVSARDLASGTINSIRTGLLSLNDRTITISTNHITTFRSVGAPGGNVPIAADGGAIEDLFAQLPRYDGGGATFGRGGPRDDLNTIRVSPGEHVFDAKDVALMGGQAGVYAFRDMLNAGQYGGPGPDNSIRTMVSTQVVDRVQTSPAGSSPSRTVNLYTPDIPTALRELKAEEHKEAVLASPWRR